MSGDGDCCDGSGRFKMIPISDAEWDEMEKSFSEGGDPPAGCNPPLQNCTFLGTVTQGGNTYCRWKCGGLTVATLCP